MVADPPPRFVTVIILVVATHVTLISAIPKLRLASEESGSDAEEKKFDTTSTDQNFMVLGTETAKGKEPVFIEFSYSDENKNQREKTEDTDRYSYRVIDSPKESTGNSVAVLVNKDFKESKEIQNSVKETEESGRSVLQPNVRRQIEFEENVPGFHNWPKHMPDHLRPLSPFDDDDRVITKAQSFAPGRQTKRDGFVPSERFPPPPRAGPYLYPQSVIDREFRVPYN